MDRTKYKVIHVRRKLPKQDCTVMLCKDRATDKWCFVNMTSKHFCACRFDTVKDAMQDLEKRDEVISYTVEAFGYYDVHMSGKLI